MHHRQLEMVGSVRARWVKTCDYAHVEEISIPQIVLPPIENTPSFHLPLVDSGLHKEKAWASEMRTVLETSTKKGPRLPEDLERGFGRDKSKLYDRIQELCQNYVEEECMVHDGMKKEENKEKEKLEHSMLSP